MISSPDDTAPASPRRDLGWSISAIGRRARPSPPGDGTLFTVSDVHDFLNGSDIYSLLDNLGDGPIDHALDVFWRAVHGSGIARGIDPEASEVMLSGRDRLAGLWAVVVEGRMPTWPAFGPLRLRRADHETNYDKARTFILRHGRRWPGEPVKGPFYPELLAFDPVERVVKLAESHVRCMPTSRRTANLHSLQGRLSEGVASKAAQPYGTTCALFLRAVLVSAGDGRFIRHPERLGLKAPSRGDMAGGIGINLRYSRSDGVRVVGRPGGEPTNIRRGDLYFVTAAEGKYQESGHVGLIVDARPAGDRVEIVTVDGGQKLGDEIYSRGKGWYTKRKRGLIRRVANSPGKWEKCSRDPRGLLIPPKISITHGETGETKSGSRTLRIWVAMREVAGAFEHAATRIVPELPSLA